MKTLLIALLTLSSASSFAAGSGSTTDFEMNARLGYSDASSCDQIDAGDKLIKYGCEMGAGLKAYGLNEKKFEIILSDLPQFDSMCTEEGAFHAVAEKFGENLSKVLTLKQILKLDDFLPKSDPVCE